MALGKLEGGQPKRAVSNQGQLRKEGICTQVVMLGPDYKNMPFMMGQVTMQIIRYIRSIMLGSFNLQSAVLECVAQGSISQLALKLTENRSGT